MRKLFIFSIVSASLLVISIIGNVLLASEWREQVAEGKSLNKKVSSLEAKIEASRENNESLREIGEDFAKTMFTFDNKTAPELKNKLLRKVEGEAKAKLQEKPKAGEISQYGATKTEFKSQADIKESSFSRVNETKAIITVHFDQVLTLSSHDSRTESTMKVVLEKPAGADQWKVYDYEMQQLY